jgi:predicted nucleic acid-binding protein
LGLTHVAPSALYCVNAARNLGRCPRLLHFAPLALHTLNRRDVDDEPYLNLAIEVQADYLVSRDNDLLDLVNPTTADAVAFQRRFSFSFVKIVDPVAFLKEIEEIL